MNLVALYHQGIIGQKYLQLPIPNSAVEVLIFQVMITQASVSSKSAR